MIFYNYHDHKTITITANPLQNKTDDKNTEMYKYFTFKKDKQ